MLLIKLDNGQPVGNPITLENFLLLYPSTSFPGYLDASITEPLGFGIYSYSKIPDDFNKATHKPIEATPVRNGEEGVWYQKWEVVPLNAEEKERVDKKQRMDVLGQRNSMLLFSDWTQLPDVKLTDEKKAEWLAYRQQLRDLPQSEGFDVWNVTWPVPPIPQEDENQAPPNVIG